MAQLQVNHGSVNTHASPFTDEKTQPGKQGLNTHGFPINTHGCAV
jgi:hypothetical protein